MQAGDIALTPFPYTDLSGSKLRPVLLLRPASERFNDWLVCMVSSQLHQGEPQFDEWIQEKDDDFWRSGLKVPSVFRLSRLAVLDATVLIGKMGNIEPKRLTSIRNRLGDWIVDSRR